MCISVTPTCFGGQATIIRGAPKVTGSVLHPKSHNITFKKQSSVLDCDNSHSPKSLQLKQRQFTLSRAAQLKGALHKSTFTHSKMDKLLNVYIKNVRCAGIAEH
jgi:hypothetical protein